MTAPAAVHNSETPSFSFGCFGPSNFSQPIDFIPSACSAMPHVAPIIQRSQLLPLTADAADADNFADNLDSAMQEDSGTNSNPLPAAADLEDSQPVNIANSKVEDSSDSDHTMAHLFDDFSPVDSFINPSPPARGETSGILLVSLSQSSTASSDETVPATPSSVIAWCSSPARIAIRRSARVNQGHCPLSMSERAEQRAQIRALELPPLPPRSAVDQPPVLGSIHFSSSLSSVPDKFFDLLSTAYGYQLGEGAAAIIDQIRAVDADRSSTHA